MKRSTKVILILLVILGAVLAAVYVLASSVYTPPEPVLEYPTGNLADNYMDADMYTYEKNDGLPVHYSFSTVPYSVDVPDASAAPIGNGAVYQIEKDYVLYITEYSDPATPQSVVQKEFPQVILINAIPESTEVVAMQDQTGKLNGFNAEYIADHITVSDGMKKQEAALFGYELDCENEYAGKHFFISVGTTVLNQESFNTMASYLNAVMRTVRFSKSLDQNLQRSSEAADLAGDSDAETDTSGAVSGNTGSGNMAAEDTAAATNVTTYTVQAPEAYTTLTVTVTWPNANDDVVLELFAPDKATFWSPVERDSNSATFIMQNTQAGDYMLNIKGSNLGDVSISPVGE